MVVADGLLKLLLLLVIWPLEVTHGQWIYRNIQVHDETQGTLRTREKDLLQWEIEVEIELGFEGFLANGSLVGKCDIGKSGSW